MITPQPTFASFKNYVFHPTYQQPLAELPGSSSVKTIRRFLTESPLILELALASCGASLLTQFAFGRASWSAVVEKYCSSPAVLLASVLIAVIIEEVVFRAVLRPTPNRLRNIAALLLWIPLGYVYQTINNAGHEFAMGWLILLWFGMVYLLSVFLIRPAVFDRISAFWQTNFRWIFYGNTAIFLLTKLTTDDSPLTSWQLAIAPITLLVMLLNSFYFGYVRMKYGFWYAVAVHTLIVTAILLPELIRCL